MPLSVEHILHGQLGLDFRIQSWRAGERGARALSVHVSGKYWLESGVREGGRYISMIVAAALANPWGPGIGLVCDLSELDYSGGDRLLQWRDLPQLRALAPYLIALVSSEANRAKVQSLVEYTDDDVLVANHFSSVEEALGSFVSQG